MKILILINIFFNIFCISNAEDTKIDITHHEFNHYHQFNITTLTELESLGELYYDEMQKHIDRHGDNGAFKELKANFPCVLGITPLGGADGASISDGHKFACGLHAVAGHPIVYSFGSHKQTDFELAILRLRPEAKIFIYEIMPSMLTPVELRDPRITYNAVGLGGYEDLPNPENFVFKTMKQMMIENNHTYIDIVKMDVEGYEYMWLKHEASLIPRIGQLLVEIHVGFGIALERFPNQNGLTFLETCESFGFRLYHQELNKHYSQCMEVSLIHYNWIKWNILKFKLVNF